MLRKFSYVNLRRQSDEPAGVQVDPRAKEAAGAAEQDHASVDELAALDARDNPHDRVVI